MSYFFKNLVVANNSMQFHFATTERLCPFMRINIKLRLWRVWEDQIPPNMAVKLRKIASSNWKLGSDHHQQWIKLQVNLPNKPE